ncbi:Mss4-like protein [Apodospora peruviana]|uniref:Mss4-like protein n=1 Tax=Apodospora peruviana TaxID=516989 RepID=A0AAE0HXL6_9PEZI|nr:Mss4-like protein [Apodospora peruviana]
MFSATAAPPENPAVIPTVSISSNETSLTGTCHCGRIEFQLPHKPEYINECLCTACYKYGALWGYFPRKDVEISVKEGATHERYFREDSDGHMSFARCSYCGVATNWQGEGEEHGKPERKMGVNMRLFERGEWEGVERRVVTK